jgi:hypothetical protein
MAWWSNHYKLIFTPRLHHYSLICHRPFYQSYVRAELQQHPKDRSRIGARGLDSDIRVSQVEATEVGRKQVGRDRGAGGDPQRSTLQPPQLTELPLGGALHPEQLTSALVQCASSSGEPDRSARSVKEIDVQLTLELVQ